MYQVRFSESLRFLWSFYYPNGCSSNLFEYNCRSDGRECLCNGSYIEIPRKDSENRTWWNRKGACPSSFFLFSIWLGSTFRKKVQNAAKTRCLGNVLVNLSRIQGSQKKTFDHWKEVKEVMLFHQNLKYNSRGKDYVHKLKVLHAANSRFHKVINFKMHRMIKRFQSCRREKATCMGRCLQGM